MNTLPTINFHLTKACNFKCKFCYATFCDIKNLIKSEKLNKKEQIQLIEKLAESKKFRKINFAGGEPTLERYLDNLIIFAKQNKFETSIVTNGSLLMPHWFEKVGKYLDILTLSVDSINDETNVESGRNQDGKTLSREKIVEIANLCHKFGIQLKINTVVSGFNKNEFLADLINEIKPFRWKILQVTQIEGQNKEKFNEFSITKSEFDEYCSKNSKKVLPEIKIIPESEEIIQGSYLMIDPLGRFYDSSNKKYNYSDKILKVGVQEALEQVSPSREKFEKREGNYSVI